MVATSRSWTRPPVAEDRRTCRRLGAGRGDHLDGRPDVARAARLHVRLEHEPQHLAPALLRLPLNGVERQPQGIFREQPTLQLAPRLASAAERQVRVTTSRNRMCGTNRNGISAHKRAPGADTRLEHPYLGSGSPFSLAPRHLRPHRYVTLPSSRSSHAQFIERANDCRLAGVIGTYNCSESGSDLEGRGSVTREASVVAKGYRGHDAAPLPYAVVLLAR